jgi:Tol biopolymer transport system component
VYRLRLDRPGAEPEQLTSDSANDYSPIMSPDGREILFHSLRRGNRDLWLLSSDGSHQRPLTRTERNEYSGSWSPDGRLIGFYAESAGTIWLGHMSKDRRGDWDSVRLVLPKVSSSPSWSPDGRQMVVIQEGEVKLVPYPAGEPVVLFRPPPASLIGRIAAWSRDGRNILYRARERDGRLTLMDLPLNGKPPVALVRQRDASKSGARTDWATDGRRFFFTIARYEGDIWTVEVK